MHRLSVPLATIVLLAACGSPPGVTSPRPSPSATASTSPSASASAASTPATPPSAGPSSPEKPSMDDVDAAAVSAQCEKIRSEQHAALDALANKGLPKKKVIEGKALFGRCIPVGKAAIVLTVDEFGAAIPPAKKDPICTNGRIHPSSLASFGCFDPPCPDCISGNVYMKLVAPPFVALDYPVGMLALPGSHRVGSEDDEGYDLGTSLGALSAAVVGTFDVDGDGWPEVLHCGTVHGLQREPLEKGCALVSTQPIEFGPSKATTAIENALTGGFRMTPTGPELSVLQIDARSSCAVEFDQKRQCTGPTLWARYDKGVFIPPLEGPDPELWKRFAAQCREPVPDAFGETIAASIIEDVFCEAVLAGKLPPEDLDAKTLAKHCPGDCPAQPTLETIYEATRMLLAGTKPSP